MQHADTAAARFLVADENEANRPLAKHWLEDEGNEAVFASASSDGVTTFESEPAVRSANGA
jgi:CheY-like chemotaxis protein